MKKQRSPAMQFYFRQFAADDAVTSLDLDAVGAHILLMCAAGSAESGFRIPADDRAIKVRLRNPSEDDYQRIKKQLLAGAWKLSDDGAFWIQDGMRRSLLKQKQFSKLQSERAKGNRNAAGRTPELRHAGNAGPTPSSTSSSTSTSKDIFLEKLKILIRSIPNPEAAKALRKWVHWKLEERSERVTIMGLEEVLKRYANAWPKFIEAVNFSIASELPAIRTEWNTNGKTEKPKENTGRVQPEPYEPKPIPEVDPEKAKAFIQDLRAACVPKN